MYLNTAQAGEILNAYKDTVVKMIKSGEIPARYVYMAGNEYRIHPDAFQPDKPPTDHPPAITVRAVLDAFRRQREQINEWEQQLLAPMEGVTVGASDTQ